MIQSSVSLAILPDNSMRAEVPEVVRISTLDACLTVATAGQTRLGWVAALKNAGADAPVFAAITLIPSDGQWHLIADGDFARVPPSGQHKFEQTLEEPVRRKNNRRRESSQPMAEMHSVRIGQVASCKMNQRTESINCLISGMIATSTTQHGVALGALHVSSRLSEPG